MKAIQMAKKHVKRCSIHIICHQVNAKQNNEMPLHTSENSQNSDLTTPNAGKKVEEQQEISVMMVEIQPGTDTLRVGSFLQK